MMQQGAFPAQDELRKDQQPVFGGEWNPSAWDRVKQLFSLAGETPAPGAAVENVGFRALSDAATRMAVTQAKAGDQSARAALMEQKLPSLTGAMSRARRVERPVVSGTRARFDPQTGITEAPATGGTQGTVSANDLANEFIASGKFDQLIDKYDPSAPATFETAMSRRAREGTRMASKLEATLPQPPEAPHKIGPVLKEVDRFTTQFGRPPSSMWISRKFGIPKEEAENLLNRRQDLPLLNRLELDAPLQRNTAVGAESRPTSEVVSAEPGRVQSSFDAIDSKVSEGDHLQKATQFYNSLDPVRQKILQHMLDGRTQHETVRLLKDEGIQASQNLVMRRQQELLKRLKDLREGRGFEGGMRGGSDAVPEYRGYQQGYGKVPGFHMWDLTEDLTDKAGNVVHPKGSTVSTDAFRRLGIPMKDPIQGER